MAVRAWVAFCALTLLGAPSTDAWVSSSPAFSQAVPRLRFEGPGRTRASQLHRLQMINFPDFGLNLGGGTDAAAAKREECKNRLLQLISTSKRGKQQTQAEKDSIFLVMQELEGLNTCAEPVESDLISGKWSLLYTAAAEEDIATRREKEGVIGSMVTEVTGSSDGAEAEDDGELPLGRRITTFANSFVENKGNYQDIEAGRNYVENRATFSVGGVPLELKIEGRCAKVEEEAKRSTRLDVFFEKVVLRVGELQVLGIPLTVFNNGTGPIGWLDTTYLDETMRLGRGDKGSFFVTVRRPN